MLACSRNAPTRGFHAPLGGGCTMDPISESEFEDFRAFFVRKTGIQFDSSKRYFVDRRLLDRIDATGVGDFRTYFAILKANERGEEMQHLTNAMTVNETYFYREEHHFRALVQSLLPELTRTRSHKRPLRIWVVPSSTGEEPYSIVLYLLEHWPDLAHWDVEVVASDIDTRVLHDATMGRYSQRSVQLLPADVLRRYFRRVGHDWQIDDEIRRSVRFTHVNVTNGDETALYRDFDVVFCRNLLFYFDDASRRRAADTFFRALEPGGFVCLGMSDAMNRISSRFVRRTFPDAVVYQKPGHAVP